MVDCRTLVAGVGNVLRGDDGFGVAVAKCMMTCPDLPLGAHVIETGIGGMTLIQELMKGYDALAIVDAYGNGALPGTLHEREPVLPDMGSWDIHEQRDFFSDTHYATPIRALSLAHRINVLPAEVRLFGCEPAELDDLKIGLSEAVRSAIEPAVAKIIAWIVDFSSRRKE